MSLVLRPADDVLLVYAQHWHEDEEINKLTGFEPGEPGVFRAKKLLENLVLSPKKNTGLLGVWEGAHPIGYVLFTNVDDFNKTADLHITISKDSQGKGHGSKAVQLALDLAYTSGIYRVTFRPFKSNKPACNLAKKLGFTLESFTKSSAWVGTTPKDQAQFRMLRNEWEKIKESE